jgi:hypothetical protein
VKSDELTVVYVLEGFAAFMQMDDFRAACRGDDYWHQ